MTNNVLDYLTQSYEYFNEVVDDVFSFAKGTLQASQREMQHISRPSGIQKK